MKKTKIGLSLAVMAITAVVLIAADHIEAPNVQGSTGDITDFYAFQGENTDNIAFVANIQGLLSPEATASAAFDENVLLEFNIDTDDDNVEDMIIQAIPRNGKMHFFGPFQATSSGLNSDVNTSAKETIVDITAYNSSAVVTTNDGISVFAGPRDDPFFMDFTRYGEVIGGMASSFNDPGTDTFAGTNVLSIVIEVPKSMIGGSGTINTWVETKRKQ